MVAGDSRRRLVGQGSHDRVALQALAVQAAPGSPNTMFRVRSRPPGQAVPAAGPPGRRCCRHSRRCALARWQWTAAAPVAGWLAVCDACAAVAFSNSQPSRLGGPPSARQRLDARHSDPLDQSESGGVAEWEREPILNLVTAVLSNCVLGGCWG